MSSVVWFPNQSFSHKDQPKQAYIKLGTVPQTNNMSGQTWSAPIIFVSSSLYTIFVQWPLTEASYNSTLLQLISMWLGGTFLRFSGNVKLRLLGSKVISRQCVFCCVIPQGLQSTNRRSLRNIQPVILRWVQHFSFLCIDAYVDAGLLD